MRVTVAVMANYCNWIDSYFVPRSRFILELLWFLNQTNQKLKRDQDAPVCDFFLHVDVFWMILFVLRLAEGQMCWIGKEPTLK